MEQLLLRFVTGLQGTPHWIEINILQFSFQTCDFPEQSRNDGNLAGVLAYLYMRLVSTLLDAFITILLYIRIDIFLAR